MSLRSGSSRRNLQSAPGGARQKLLPRAESAKNFDGMQVTGTSYYQQMRDAKAVSNNKNSAMITEDDLIRIKQQCWMSKEDEESEAKAREKRELQIKSKARVANWPNTIEATRLKRQEEKLKKLQEEEMERRKLDAIEDEMNQQKRLQAIEAANKKMHDQQDQVKAFHSKMLLCDVIQEREAQQDLKKRKEKYDKVIEDQWIELEQRKMEEFDEKTKKKLEEYYQKKRENAKVIKNQLHDFKMTHIKRIKEEMLEGELIKRKAKEDMEAEQQKQLERKLKQAKTREEFKKANDDLQRFNEELRRKEAEELKKIEAFALKKERMEQLRREKEAQKFKEKQETRQKMIEKQIEYLSQLKNREDEILNKQVAEAEEKANQLFLEKERKKQLMKEQIERSRKLQMDKKYTEKENEKRDEKEFAEFWKIRNDELQVAEEQEKEEIRQRQAQLKTFQKSQAENKKKKVEEDFIKELQQAEKSNALLDQNEKQFYSYAEQCIKEWQDAGKNVKPLILELKNYKKRSLYQ